MISQNNFADNSIFNYVLFYRTSLGNSEMGNRQIEAWERHGYLVFKQNIWKAYRHNSETPYIEIRDGYKELSEKISPMASHECPDPRSYWQHSLCCHDGDWSL